MTARERVRLRVLHAVAARQLSLMQAADQMSVSYRQARRLWSRFEQQGDAGLVIGCVGGRAIARLILNFTSRH